MEEVGWLGRPTVRGLYSRKGRKWHATCGREREQLSSYELESNSVCLVEPVLGLYRVRAGRWGESLGITFLSGSSRPISLVATNLAAAERQFWSRTPSVCGGARSDADVWFSGVEYTGYGENLVTARGVDATWLRKVERFACS